MGTVFRILLLPVWLIRRFTVPLVVIALTASLALNATMLMVSGVYAAASGVLSAAGITTAAAREANKRAVRASAVRRIGSETAEKVSRRVQRGAARSIASVGGEAVPFLGVAVIAGALSLEVKDACDTAADMAGLEAALAAGEDPVAARQAAIEKFDCKVMIREQLPGYENLPSKEDIWASVKRAPAAAYNLARDAGIQVAEVDWAGKAGAALGYVLDLAGYFDGFASVEDASR